MAPDIVRALIADAVLERDHTRREVGAVQLHEHQRAAVSLIRPLLNEVGGALLADAVGLGKTYVALAVADRYARPVVIAPAVLRSTWQESAATAGVAIDFVSTESLSRRRPSAAHDLVVVDEAHHFRSSHTRRYAHLAELAAATPVLLLSATPIHNRRADLEALLALFLGTRGRSLPDAELGKCVVRREHEDVPRLTLPRLRGVRRVEIPGDAAVLEAIDALPAPLAFRDGTAAAALVRLGLLYSWASSDAALLAAIGRRLAAGAALREALEHGRLPTRREIAPWLAAPGVVQLGFTELLLDPTAQDSAVSPAALDAHLEALRRLARLVSACPSRDAVRVDALRTIRRAHPRERIVVFSAYAETARRVFGALAHDGGVGMISGGTSRIATGRVSRDEVLRMFRSPGHQRERIQLLLATDLLSEGLNLPEASVVVHIDLPWTAARVEQRIGRLRRPTSTAAVVVSYALVQPSAIERRLRKEALLRAKSRVAAAAVGPLSLRARATERRPSPPRAVELIRRFMAEWRSRAAADAAKDAARSSSGTRILVAGAAAERDGFLALVRTHHGARIACGAPAEWVDSCASFDPARILALLPFTGGPAVPVRRAQYRSARRAIEQLQRREAGLDLVAGQSRAVITLERRLRETVATAPIHCRRRTAARVAAISAALHRSLTIGMERMLDRLLTECDDCAELISRCESLLQQAAARSPPRGMEVSAVLLLVRR